jgi:branched-chain amino acid transport system permease protein
MTALAALGWSETTIQNAMLYSLVGLSVYVALRAGMFSLAGVGFYGIGAYCCGRLVIEGVPTPVAIVAALALAATLGFALALVFGRLRDLYLVMATFAFVLLIEILAREWDAVTGGAVGLLGIPVEVTTAGLGAALVIATAVVVASEHGRGGRTLAAVRGNEELARTLGIPVLRRRIVAFVLSCMLGSLAGALYALMFNIMTPDQISFAFIVDALTMIVIGGTAAWYGPLIGATIVIWLPELLRFTGDWRTLVQGVVVVVIVVYFPGGASSLVQLTARFLARRRPVIGEAPIALPSRRADS